MKRLLLILALSLPCLAQIQVGILGASSAAASGAPLAGQHWVDTSGTAHLVQAFASNIGAGSTIWVAFFTGSASTISSITICGAAPTGSLGPVDTGSQKLYNYYLKNTSAGACTVDILASGAGVGLYTEGVEVTGASTTAPLDTTVGTAGLASATGNSNAPSVSATPAGSNELCLNFVRIDAATTLTKPASYTQLDNPGVSAAWAWVQPAGATTAAWTSTGSGAWAETTICLKP